MYRSRSLVAVAVMKSDKKTARPIDPSQSIAARPVLATKTTALAATSPSKSFTLLVHR
jgi:hypothetical protein